MVESTTLYSFTLSQLIEPGQLLQAVIEGEEASLTHCTPSLQYEFFFHWTPWSAHAFVAGKASAGGLLPWSLKFFRKD